MIVAHITDLHVMRPGELCMGRYATNDSLRAAVAHLNGLEARPDTVIVTGDVVEDGSPEAYAEARAILDELTSPYYPILGNHDDRAAFLEAFAHVEELPRSGAPFAHYAVERFPVRLVGLDTNVPGEPHGELCDARLAWLDATLAEDDRPTLVFLHHPPFATGIRWIDDLGLLVGAEAFEAVVARRPHVVRVACGHIHRPIQAAWGGTLATVAPSTSHQVALGLAEPATSTPALADEPTAVLLHVLGATGRMLTHASYIVEKKRAADDAD